MIAVDAVAVMTMPLCSPPLGPMTFHAHSLTGCSGLASWMTQARRTMLASSPTTAS
jgi:hypothetical protein